MLGIAVLAVGVAATSIVVPPLVLSWSGDDARSVEAGRRVAATGGSASPSTTPSSTPLTPSTSAGTATPSAGTATTSATITTTTLPSPATTTPSTAAPTSAAFVPLTIDATDPRNRASGTEATLCPACVSGSRVKYLGQGHTLVVPVTDVPVAGLRTMTIVYTCDGTRPLQVSVAGGVPVSLSLSGIGWETPMRVTIPIDLPAGDSDIAFFGADPAPDLDRIIIE